MANLNENLEKVKSVVEDTAKKAQESETFSKVKSTASDVTQKIKENETVANAVDKINQNEYVAKVNKSQYAKFIKLGAVIIAIVLIFNLFGWIFGDNNAKKAQKYLVTEITTMLENDSATNCKVKAKAIGKNEDASLYAFDTIVSCKYSGEKIEYTSFYIIYYDGEDAFVTSESEYQKENKSDI